MSKIKQIIHNELSGVLPVHLARDIAQRLTTAFEREGIKIQEGVIHNG